jgi:hypothetical protein
MNFRRAVAILPIVALAFANPHHAMAAGKLSNIFKYDMLNAELPYLESIIGPAMHVSDDAGIQTREYRVEGCKVKAFVEGTQVRRYALSLTPKCNFNIGDFLSGYPSTSGITVGKFVGGPQHPAVRLRTDCIYLCGNSTEETVDFVWDGPHSDSFISIALTVVVYDRASVDAATRVTDLMKKNNGEDYMIDTRFNCDGKYDDVAARGFANIPVKEVTIGFNKSGERCPK